jgi:hypothetical protein
MNSNTETLETKPTFGKPVLANGEFSRTQKAFGIDLGQINEGFCYSPIICHAESRSKAKSILLKKEPDLQLWSGDEVTYLNMPIVRMPEYDLFEFEDKELNKEAIAKIIAERERRQKIVEILNDKAITHCYIKKGSYYRPNWSGYTDYTIFAGVYEKEAACDHVFSVQNATVFPINISEHNKLIEDEIADLKSRLIATVC